MEKSHLESIYYCYLTIKNILGLKKNTKEIPTTFGPQYHALTLV